eukprot:505756-Prymnesium_polylepis.1
MDVMEKMMVRTPSQRALSSSSAILLTHLPVKRPQAKFDITGQGTILDVGTRPRGRTPPVVKTPPARAAAPEGAPADEAPSRSGRQRSHAARFDAWPRRRACPLFRWLLRTPEIHRTL